MTVKYDSQDPYQLERIESKYTIPVGLIEPISDFASIYCSLDRHAAASSDGFYRINNLYFDTPDFLFLRRRLANCENRFNMRIRSYSDTGTPPCFFEVKQRKDNAIKKMRSVVDDEDWRQLFDKPGHDPEDGNRNGIISASYKSLFLKLALSYNAAPKVLTQYRRRAFVSQVDDYGRVTIDTDLRCQSREYYDVIPDDRQMVSCDDVTRFDPGCSAVLELKCYASYVPLWMSDLIRHFDLPRRSFSKYVAGITRVLDRYRYDPSIRHAKEILSS